MSDWLNNQQWTAGTQASGIPPSGGSNWNQQQQVSSNMAGSNWQPMQQGGPPTNLYQNNQQYRPPPGQNQQGAFPFQNRQGPVPFQQQQGQYQNPQVPYQNSALGFAPRSQFGGPFPGGPGGARMGPIPGAGTGAGNFSYQGSPPQQHRQQMQQQMSPQLLRQQQQQALEQRLKEEQRQRELEVQRRKMRNMDITKATVGNLDNLIGMTTPSESGSPTKSRSKKTTGEKCDDPLPAGEDEKSLRSKLDDFKKMKNDSQSSKARSDSTGLSHSSAMATSGYSESSKARSWTSDSTSLEGLFAQHSQLATPTAAAQQPTGDGFGDFQSGPSSAESFRPSQGGGGGVGVSNNPDQPGLVPRLAGASGQPRPPPQQPQQRKNVMSRKVAQGPVSFTAASQRPVLSTSESGVNKKGYISSDVIQSQSYGFVGGGAGKRSANAQPPSSSLPSSSSSGGAAQQNQSVQSSAGLDSSRFPAVYAEVYQQCRGVDGSISTELLFPLLLSSHLQRAVLRDLWTQANRGVPGRLNQMELYVLLGLIALVQGGNSSPTVEDLKRAPHPPVPVLAAVSTATGVPTQSASTNIQQPKSSSTALQPTPSFGNRGDDFGDFQQGQGDTMSFKQHSAASSLMDNSKPHPSVTKATTKTTTTMGAESQPETALSTAFPVPEYKAPPGDKYSAFESLTQASGELREVATTLGSSTSDQDKYASLVGLASSSSSFGTGGVPLVPTPAASIAPLQPSTVSTGSVQSQGKPAGKLGGDKPLEEDEFGSFLSGPSFLQPSTSSSKANKLSESHLLSSTATTSGTSKTQETLADDFGSFTSGPSLDFAKQQQTSSKSGVEDSEWANFTQFTSHADVPSQSSAVSSTSFSQAHHTSTQPSLVPTQAPPSLIPTPAAASSTAQGNVSIFSSGSSSDSISTATASLLGDLNITAPKSSPQNSKKSTKVLSGLEMLEEEFSSRILSQPDEAPPHSLPVLSPKLNLEPSASGSATSLEKFGEFEGFSADSKDGLECVSGSATSFGKSPPDPGKVWLSCLRKCSEVLSECVGVLGGCKDEEEDGRALLQEIATSEEGLNKLKGIMEVYKLARRIHACIRENNCDNDDFKDLVGNIKKEWSRLDTIFPVKVMDKLFQESISSQQASGPGKQSGGDKDFLSDTISRCSLCLMGKEVSIPPSGSLSSSPETYSLPLLFHDNKTYHATCCNFWSNVVQEPLPDLSD